MRFKTEFALPIALVLMLLLCPQAASQSTRIFRTRPPQPTNLPDFRFAHCTLSPGQLRICKAVSDDGDRFIVERAGKRVGSWPAIAFLADTSNFEVLQSDLDGDGRSELIFANHTGTSNGLGVDYWTIYIFPDAEFRGPQDPLVFNVEEYGARGTFVPRGDSILILTTKWLWSEDPRGKRGLGLYLVGHWWRYRSGKLIPLIERPIQARRYLDSFATERGRTDRDPRRPYLWLQNRNAVTFKVNPLIGTGEREVKRGILQGVSISPFAKPETSVVIAFRPEQGNAFTLQYPLMDVQEPRDDLAHVGDAVSGRIYPERYLPASLEKWLGGRRARLVTYGKRSQSEGLRVLWLDP
jgi:hypothetical protein